ncbi:MAG: DUF192 domain-containing protein [Saprospiraceae bacterium]
MSSRRNKKASPPKKAGGKKLRWSWGSIIAIFLALLFLASMVFTRPGGFGAATPNKGSSSQASTKNNASAEPPFKKEGQLTFRVDDKIAQQIDIEIVDQPQEIQQGLMYRTKMAENQGMLFIFPQEEPRSFWMRNTFIPLDIIYVNSNKEIVSIQKYTTPKSDKSLPSEADAQYVIEVNAGFCDRYSIGKGTVVEF